MIQRSHKVVRDAEAALRTLIEEGLREQRYSEISEVAQLADRVANLLSKQADPLPAEDQQAPPKVPEASSRKPKASTPSPSLPPPRRDAKKKKKTAAKKTDYPRFERERDRLIKVGWSKKNKESYEHRAPREAVIAFARHLANEVKVNEVFSMDDILPVPDITTGDAVPDYQSYLTLAWLRDTKAIEKKGRDGYVLRMKSLSTDGLDSLWNNLPERKA